ncbi:PGG domain [Macleaya cordata]|uniref:PGG domain n=1 Tax=Macleaya cordata TaxID=56857 RepID=A0A200RAQ9_MACCD|nr:PGG domain [Macleaya cordata]
MGEMLVRVGAMRSRDIISQPPLHSEPSTNIMIIREPAQPASSTSGNLWKEIKKEMDKELEDSASEIRSALMVVAILIATMTFQAGTNPPGGFWQDIYFPENNYN